MTTKQDLTLEDLQLLPVGGQYQSKSGRATGTVKRTDKGYEFTANCDSLQLLVTDLETEVYRLNREKTELKTTLKELETIEVNKLNGWQKFRITVGDFALGALSIGVLAGLYYLLRKFKIIK